MLRCLSMIPDHSTGKLQHPVDLGNPSVCFLVCCAYFMNET